MTDNPYQPTVTPSSSQFAPLPAVPFQSTASLTNWVVGLLVLTSVCTLFLGIADVAFNAIFDTASDATLATIGVILLVCGIGGALTYLVCAIVFLVWVHRTTKNGHALGGTALTSPGWAVGYWFIPILNLFRPYQVLREVFRVSYGRKTPESIHSIDLPSVFGTWWAFWVISSIIGRVESRLARIEVDLTVSLVISILGTITTLAAAFFAIQVVKTVSQTQDEHHQELSGQSSDANPYAPA